MLVIAMLSFHAPARPLAAFTFAAATLAILMPAAPADAKGTPKKKKSPLTATVSATFSIKVAPNEFGNDNGENWQSLTYEINNAKIPFMKGVTTGASATVNARIKYEAKAHTADRSWHAGCDIEDRHSAGSYNGDVQVSIGETSWLQTDGKSKKSWGWTVTPTLPDDVIVSSGGFYEDWESILMETCVTYGVNTPLGGWSLGFASPDAVGKMNSERRSVLLNTTNTASGQTGSAKGTIKFSKTMPR